MSTRYFIAGNQVFTERERAEHFRAGRLENEHYDVIECVPAEELAQANAAIQVLELGDKPLPDEAKRLEAECAVLRKWLKEAAECITEWRKAGLISGTLDLETLLDGALASTTAGKELLEKLERYEKALDWLESQRDHVAGTDFPAWVIRGSREDGRGNDLTVLQAIEEALKG